ncbi:MAG: hypothetical protein JW804_01450 [Sedimentisphaerales bacterium]|nr:hypothetical protein [Sedimentisphaerales bacterium]
MARKTKKGSILGWAAGVFSGLSGKKNTKPTEKDLSRLDFKASTQKIGVSLTERIRDVFRFKWIRKK